MKKTLIALTLAALPVASMAEVVLYGQIKGGVEVTKVKDVKGTVTNIVDYGSRIGFKGQEQLNDSLKAIWQLEQSVNIGGGKNSKGEPTGFGTRDSFIGLESPAGTVKVGNLSTPVKDANGLLDEWEYSSSAAGLGVFTRSNDAVGRHVAVQYETPNMGGFSAKAYVSPSDNNRLEEAGDTNQTAGGEGDNRRYDRPVYGVGASYQQPGGGFFADAAGVYVKRGMNNGSEKGKHGYQAIGQTGYRTDNMLFGVAYQHAQDVDNFATLTGVDGKHIVDDDSNLMAKDYKVKRSQEVAATAAYTINNALTVKGSAAYGFNIKDHDGDKLFGNGKYLQGIVGADYKLSKRTQLNGQIGYLQFGKKENDAAIGTVGVGLKHKF